MCPFCFATMGLIVACATSAGGLTALGVKLSHRKNGVTEVLNAHSKERSNEDGNKTGCCRIFSDANGKNSARSAEGHVPLVEAARQKGYC